MNDFARETLTQAALNGVRQIKGKYFDRKSGGRCALGVLGFPIPIAESELYDLDPGLKVRCPVEGCVVTKDEPALVVHLNDDHNWDFLMIATKFPQKG